MSHSEINALNLTPNITLKESLQLILKNPKILIPFLLTALIQGVYQVFYLLILKESWHTSNAEVSPPIFDLIQIQPILALLLFLQLGSFLFSAIWVTILIRQIMKEEKQEKSISLFEGLRSIKDHLLFIFGFTVSIFLILILPSALDLKFITIESDILTFLLLFTILIIVIFILVTMLFYVIPAMVFEKKNFTESIKRSYEVFNASKGLTLSTAFFLGLISVGAEIITTTLIIVFENLFGVEFYLEATINMTTYGFDYSGHIRDIIELPIIGLYETIVAAWLFFQLTKDEAKFQMLK